MPYRPGHPCAHRGCAAVVKGRARYCPVHAEEGRAYDLSRGSASQRGYGGQWRKIRALVLAERPLCADPYGLHPNQVVLATDVDHIIPLAAGGSNARENLQPLCHSCHSAKTARDNGGFGNAPRTERGGGDPSLPGLPKETARAVKQLRPRNSRGGV